MKKSYKIISVLVLIVGLLGGVYWASSRSTDTSPEEVIVEVSTPTVITTLFPVYDATRALLGNDATVSMLVDAGIEPHSFEPTPSDIVAINQADIFVYTSLEMEPWVKDILVDLPSSVKVVDASEGIVLIEGTHEEHGDEPGHEGEEDHTEEEKHSEELDPHYWLDFDNAAIMTQTISRAIQEVSPENTEMVTTNEVDYLTRLQDFDAVYLEGLSECRSNTVVQGGHFILGYLTERYGLEYRAAQGLSPNSEPTAQMLAELVRVVDESNVEAVFSETLLSSRITDTISEETGVSVLPLNGLDTVSAEDFQRGITYFDVMETNLANLKVGLGCE